MTTSNRGHVQHINPDDLPKNPAFTNVIVVTGPAKMIYIGSVATAIDSAARNALWYSWYN